MKRFSSSLFMAVCAAVLLSAPPGEAANPCVVLPDGRKIEGIEVRANLEGVVYLTTAAGRVEYPKGTKVLMDQPPEMGRAAELLQKKQYDEAISILGKAVSDYRFLDWDLKAMNMLAQAYIGKQDWNKAVETFESLLAQSKESAGDEAVKSGYLLALAGSGNKEKAAPLLDAAIAKGPRAEAAQALVIRGKVRLVAGDIESALYDFMCAARYYREFKAISAEGAFRAAECLEKLGDKTPAEAYYALVAKEFPDSPFAAQARVKTGTKP